MKRRAKRAEDAPLPHDAHAERVLLAGVLREPDANAAAFTELSAGELYVYPHRLVFDAALSLWASFRPVSPADVYAELRAAGRLAELGWNPALFLADLYDADPTGASCGWACHRVAELALRRRAVARTRERLADLYAGRLTPDEVRELV